MAVLISPSILAADFRNLEKVIRKLERADVDFIHFDVMDGGFVPNITFGPKFISDLRKLTNLKFDVHLMIKDPLKYIDEFIRCKPDLITYHYEATCNHNKIIKIIKQNKIMAGVSIKPKTDVKEIKKLLNKIDLVLVMTVEPGFYGQEIIQEAIPKITEIRKLSKKILIEVDGGIKLSNYRLILSAGADILVVGSGFFENKNYKKVVKMIKYS